MSVEDQMRRMTFHHHLLLTIMDKSQYPFYALVVEKELCEDEMMHVFHLCEELHEEWESQKEEGLIDTVPLLLHFAGMLTPKLDIKETIEALDQQGYYRALMAQLRTALKKIDA